MVLKLAAIYDLCKLSIFLPNFFSGLLVSHSEELIEMLHCGEGKKNIYIYIYIFILLNAALW